MMRQVFISGLILLSTLAGAAASDRYPTTKRYVSQTGQIVAIGSASQVVEIAPTLKRRHLARTTLEVVRLVETPVIIRPARRVAQLTHARTGVFSDLNADPANWPSGRKCCVSGQPYFNEEPNS